MVDTCMQAGKGQTELELSFAILRRRDGTWQAARDLQRNSFNTYATRISYRNDPFLRSENTTINVICTK